MAVTPSPNPSALKVGLLLLLAQEKADESRADGAWRDRTTRYASSVTSGYIPKLLPISPLTDAVHILASGMFQGDVSHLPL